MWGNETPKLFSQLPSTPLEPLCMGHELPTRFESSKKLSYYIENAKISENSFQIDMIS